MLYIRRAEDRIRTDEGWLDSRHTFSFGEHRDPRFDGFRRLRVIDDDRIAPGSVFPQQAHGDVDTVSYVVEGALAHGDAVVARGDVLRVSGVITNASDSAARFLRIELASEERDRAAPAEQKHFDTVEKMNRLRLIASGHRRDDAVALREDVDIYASVLSRGAKVEHSLAPARYAWIQVISGAVKMNGVPLAAGDGAALAEVPSLALLGDADEAELLLFDLA